MRGRVAAIVAVAGCLVPSAPALGASWNGGFEDPDIPTGTWGVWSSIPYWSAINSCGVEVQDHVAGAPVEGGQFVELNSNCRSGISTIISSAYPLRRIAANYYFSARPRTQAQDNVMQVLLDGKVVPEYKLYGLDDSPHQTVGPVAGGTATSWERWYFSVQSVPAGSHTLTFKSVGTNPSGGGVGAYLDDVEIDAEVATDPASLCRAPCG